MGQQQLLLVILVTIIVGIATVVAINIFGTAADQANRDAVRQDLLAAAAQAQALWARPAAMGGFGQSFATGEDVVLDIRRLNIPRSSDITDTYSETTIINDNGTFTIEENSGTGTSSTITIRGVPNSGGGWIEVTLNREDDAQGDTWEIEWAEGTD